MKLKHKEYREWENKFNPFNSIKALCWRDRFEKLAEGKIPHPVSMTVTSTNKCNINCEWCHYRNWRCKSPNLVREEKLLWLADFLVEWQPVSVCMAGGGEFLMHSAAGKFMEKLNKGKVELGLITNGTLIDKFEKEILNCLRWVGVSVDAGTAETYEAIKQSNLFQKALSNIKLISEKRKNRRPSIGFKFLLHPKNIKEIFLAAKIAKEIGADDFHARPCYQSKLFWKNAEIKQTISEIEKARRALEDDSFHVYGITHKFDPNFRKKIKYGHCEVTPISGTTFAADGYVYACCDLMGEPMGKMCTWEEIEDYWGSEKHKNVIKNINPRKCPIRCTFQPYQEILEEVFKKDKMTYKFP